MRPTGVTIWWHSPDGSLTGDLGNDAQGVYWTSPPMKGDIIRRNMNQWYVSKRVWYPGSATCHIHLTTVEDDRSVE